MSLDVSLVLESLSLQRMRMEHHQLEKDLVIVVVREGGQTPTQPMRKLEKIERNNYCMLLSTHSNMY